MSIVNKMTIQGIRSFSPFENKVQTIEFQTPLTILVGSNGSGKTTIIEALKFVITDTFPPNSKMGSSFVNDPKLTNGHETNAMVKLDMTDSNGVKITTSRRLKVSVKDKLGNLQKKEFDATCKTVDTQGKVNDLSSKCFDIKLEMCRFMGVSEAILNNVILCHQEDSCWPLDEAKKVKEKFDAIFNTTAYIKCLDALNKQDKELGQKAKIETNNLAYVSENRKIARNKKKQLDKEEIKYRAALDKIQQEDIVLKEMEVELKQLEDLEKKYAKTLAEITLSESNFAAVDKQIKEVRANLKNEFKGSKDDLEEEIKDFAQTYKEKVKNQKQVNADVKEKEAQLQRLRKQQNSFSVKEGIIQQDEDANRKREENIQKQMSEIGLLVKKLMETSQDMSFTNSMKACISACDSEMKNVSPEEVVKALDSAIRARRVEYEARKEEYDKEQEELQHALDDLKAKKTSLEKEIEIKIKQVNQDSRSVQDLSSRLFALEGSDAKLEMLQSSEQNLIADIKAINDAGLLEKYEGEMRGLAKEIQQLEDDAIEVENDVEILQSDNKALNAIEIHNNKKILCQNECRQIMNQMEDDLKVVLKDVPDSGLAAKFDKARDALKKEIQRKSTERKQMEKTMTVKETSLNHRRDEVQRKQKRQEDLRNKCDELLDDGEEFNTALNDIKKDLEVTQKRMYYAAAEIHLNKKDIKKLKESDCCPRCKRSVTTKRQLQELIKQIEDDIERIENSKPADEARVSELQTKEDRLTQLQPSWVELEKLSSELPTLKKSIKEMEEELSELQTKLDDATETIDILETDKSIFDKHNKNVTNFESKKNDVAQCDKEVKKVENSRNAQAKALGKKTTLSASKTKLEELKEGMKTKRREKDSKSGMLTKKRKELNDKIDEKNTITKEILDITADMQGQESLRVQKDELQQKVKDMQASIANLKKQVPTIKSEIDKAGKHKSKLLEENEENLLSLRGEKEDLERRKEVLSTNYGQVKEFEKRKSGFVATRAGAAECKRSVELAEEEKASLEKKAAAITKEIADHEVDKRNLEDNLSLKLKVEELGGLKKTLEEKKKLFHSTQHKGVAAEYREKGEQHHKKLAAVNELRGSSRATKGIIESLRKELSESPYVNAEKEYSEKYFKKIAYEKAQKDVRRYKTALDQAIMLFHKQRMEMINRSLRDYWRRIYKGNDIDYIAIRTEAGDGATSSKAKIDTGKARKNYNYRVVMVRHNTELDMRGRCSAGQRVLASIIIRIALADSFSARCGIITLDEPTTNLDQKNINSLAAALSSLAERMSKQRNFQLIVITHDQEFVERLSSIDAVEKYWRVHKDPSGFSQISVVHKRAG